MKKTFRNSIVLTACLLLAMMVKATVIGGDANSTTGSIDPDSVAGCEEKKKELKRIDCLRATPVYACGTEGTKEVCVTAQACPAN